MKQIKHLFVNKIVDTHTQKTSDAFFGPALPSEVSESAFFRNDFEKKKFRNGNAKPGNKKCLWAGTEKGERERVR